MACISKNVTAATTSTAGKASHALRLKLRKANTTIAAISNAMGSVDAPKMLARTYMSATRFRKGSSKCLCYMRSEDLAVMGLTQNRGTGSGSENSLIDRITPVLAVERDTV